MILSWLFFFHRKMRPMKEKRSARIALRRNGRMSLTRPAAGGESCRAGFFFIVQKRIYFAVVSSCRLALRNALGDIPDSFLKVWEKQLEEEKPQERLMTEREKSVVESRVFAFSTRARIRQLIGEMPYTLENACTRKYLLTCENCASCSYEISSLQFASIQRRTDSHR